MTIARLAARNLLRSPRRTTLTTIAIVAGVGFFILGEGFLSGMTENIIVSAIRGTVGHVMARPADYPTQLGTHPVDELLELSSDTRALLEAKATAWTERTYFAPLAAAGRDSLRVVAIGYDPDRDHRVFPRTEWKVAGQMPAREGREIAVSHRVARLLSLAPGDRLVLQVRTHKGAINALEVKVAGVVTTRNAALDTLGIFVPAALAHELIAAREPSHVSIALASRKDAEAFASELRARLGDQAEVVTWHDETAELVRLQDVRRRALDLVMFILMALSAFGIANTILMAAHERVREIGTLRAMGMPEGGVIRLFLLEGAMMGILGSLLGALWGGGLVAYWGSSPIDLTAAFESSRGAFSASALLYTRFDWAVVISTTLLAVIVAALASIYPARVASRMSPAEAVRAT